MRAAVGCKNCDSWRLEVKESSVTGKSDEAMRTIGEVAESLDLPPHVLRFWETRFKQIDPVKRAGGRRYLSAARRGARGRHPPSAL